MDNKSEILFIADYRGSTQTWRVIKRYGSGWLCCLKDNASVTAKFNDASIKFGQARLLVKS